ncbi:TonB-dependent receptor [Pseudomonas guariconensis]|uniref:TonB-dependent receptor n=1 Tax=Pseudomonas TaxID=286 RepID=UPI002098559F|nr:MULTISPECIES: TonB-dependent receptor [Pseudomonas]MCO7640086.1 TonB-dependent receptor [Pseudomonas sp. S 311-6]MCO7514489.1 TonB-dependent receptor [Pseudomonas putida]MCO7565453.1 TonB-dependent receptor [Pseudomonas mosselii]MCO7604542.1 TonB-dependent receptor [Pseudomonas guariconensis]MCO7616663.1 TonB-dependent receptor [Pseudomonas guariconensis]
MIRNTSLVLLLGTCTSAWAAPAPIELTATTVEGEREAPSGVQLDEPIRTGSRLGLTARQTPASVSVSDRNVIEARGAKDTQDVINAMTGVNASANPGYGGFVSYRGFTQNQVTQLFNGINLGYSSATRPLDAWVIDRVELIGGPSSFLHGAGAVGGSINYISKLASRDAQTFDGRLRYGSYDDSEIAFGINQALADNPADARHFARLDFSHGHGNGYVDRNERWTDSLAFSVLSDLSPNLTHTLALEYQEDKEDSPYWGSPILPGRSTMKIDKSRRFENYNVGDGRYEQRVRWVRSILDYQLGDSTSVQNTLYHYNAERDYRNLESYRYDNDGKVVRASPYLQRHQQNVLGDRVELRHDNQVLGLASQWSLGLDYSRMRQTLYPTSGSWSDVVDPEHFDPGSFDDIPGVNAGLTKQRRHEVTNRALFAENRLQLTERLALLTGLRYDYLDMEVTNYGTVTPTSPAFFERRWEPLSGRVGLTYELTPSASVYLQYSTSADLPAGSLASATYSNVGLFDLSKGEQWEAGSKFDFLDGRGAATVAVYQIVRKDFAVRDSRDPNLTVQAGQQTSRGIELSARLQVTPQLLAEANYAYVDAQYDEFNEAVNGVSVSRKGNAPVNVPANVGNLWLTYSFGPAWAVGMDARYVDSVYADNANTLKAPAYTLLGAFARYRLDEHTALTARVRNLTDELYAKQAYGGQYYMGAPRTFEVAMDLRF